jgi:hypothetical protein
MFKYSLTTAILTLCLFGTQANALTPAQSETALETQIIALQVQVIALQKLLSLVQSNSTGQSSSISALQTTVANLQKIVTTTQAKTAALQTTVASIQLTDNSQNVQVGNLQSAESSLQQQLTTIENNSVLALGPFVTVDPNPETGVIGPNVTFHGINVHIVSGSGSTNDNGNPTGLGNLIVGYDEDPATSDLQDPYTSIGPNPLTAGDRSGSNNLVVGRWNRFNASAFGGFVAGENNTVTAEGATIAGGGRNKANGILSAIVAGYDNIVTGAESVVVGGTINQALYYESVVLCGAFNQTNGPDGVVLGGEVNKLYGSCGVLLGGTNQSIDLNSNGIWPNPANWPTAQAFPQ